MKINMIDKLFECLRRMLPRLQQGSRELFQEIHPSCVCCGSAGATLAPKDLLPIKQFLPQQQFPLQRNWPAVVLCTSCRQQIAWIRKIACPICGRAEACDDCKRREETYFTMNRSSVRYTPLMREWLALYKFRGRERLLPLLSVMMLLAVIELIKELPADRPSPVLSYVPIHPIRLQERGFNQAEQLARQLSAMLHLPLIPLLIRSRFTQKQSKKGRTSRTKDLIGVFEMNPTGLANYLSVRCNGVGRPIILVDDVYTTGSTLNECAKVLKKGVAVHCNIYSLTWAR